MTHNEEPKLLFFFGFDLKMGQQCVGTDICKMSLPAKAGSTVRSSP